MPEEKPEETVNNTAKLMIKTGLYGLAGYLGAQGLFDLATGDADGFIPVVIALGATAIAVCIKSKDADQEDIDTSK